MAIREVKLFQIPPIIAVMPVIPVTTTPCNKYRYNEYEPEMTRFHPDDMTGEDIPWYLQPEMQGVAKEIYDATSSDRTSAFACKACGVIPSVRDRRYVVKTGNIELACSAECVATIKKRKG